MTASRTDRLEAQLDRLAAEVIALHAVIRNIAATQFVQEELTRRECCERSTPARRPAKSRHLTVVR